MAVQGYVLIQAEVGQAAVRVLEAAGYAVGLTGKGWGPGSIEGTGRTRTPAAGRAFRNAGPTAVGRIGSREFRG